MSTLERCLACPVCRGSLSERRCLPCGNDYAGQSKVPNFVARQMYASATDYENARRVIDFWGNGWAKRLGESEHSFLYDLDAQALRGHAAKSLAWHKSAQTLMGVEVPAVGPEGKIALNIGCGSGSESLLLAHMGATCIAMDITSQAAEAADKLLSKLDAGFGVQADSRHIPLIDASVDLVYSSGVLHHSTDIKRSFCEIHRVLKPGGVACIMLYSKWSIMFLQEKLLQWPGEAAWETEGRKNPLTTTHTATECRQLLSAFDSVVISKRGGSMRHVAKIGRFLLPSLLDPLVWRSLGPNLNIVATKAKIARP